VSILGQNHPEIEGHFAKSEAKFAKIEGQFYENRRSIFLSRGHALVYMCGGFSGVSLCGGTANAVEPLSGRTAGQRIFNRILTKE
jgi:hypothetical protein